MKNRSRQKKTNEMLPVIIIAAGALLIIAALLLQVVKNPAAATTGSDVPEPQIERVTLANSKAALDSKSALFLDVRDAQSYAAGHVPGAINIPYGELESRLSELDSNQWIITYCT